MLTASLIFVPFSAVAFNKGDKIHPMNIEKTSDKPLKSIFNGSFGLSKRPKSVAVVGTLVVKFLPSTS